jgi:queuine tRNA-ribosyltransferase
LGIGGVEDFFECIERGIDSFDCVAPTREARNGALMTKSGRLNILKTVYKVDKNPVEKDCGCYTCKNFSKAYLRHLFVARELLAYQLATIHNIYFTYNLVRKIRQSILDGSFLKFKKDFLRI